MIIQAVNTPSLSLVFLCVCSLSTVSAAADKTKPVVAPKPENQKYLLRYKFTEDEEVHYKVHHTTMMHSRLGQAVEIARNKSEITKHYRVVSVGADHNAILELVLDQVSMQASYDGGEAIKWNSAEDESVPPQFRAIHQTIGRPLARIKISPQGKLLSVPHVDQKLIDHGNLFNKGVQSAENDPSRNFLIVFPEDEIAVGDSWQNKIEVPFSVSKKLHKRATLLRNYKLDSVEGSLAVIELETTLLTIINDPTIRVQLIQRVPSGKITFDLDRGKIKSRELIIDKTEIGALGPKSSLHAVSSVRENLMEVTNMASKK